MAQVAQAHFQYRIDSDDFEAFQQQQLQRQIEQQQQLQRQHQQLIQQQLHQQPNQPVLKTQPLFHQEPVPHEQQQQQRQQPVLQTQPLFHQEPIQQAEQLGAPPAQFALGSSEPLSQGDDEIDVKTVKILLSKLLFASKDLIDNLDEETLKTFLKQ